MSDAEFDEDCERNWQHDGLLVSVGRAISDVKVPDRWLLPEPPDKGLITSVLELVSAASALHVYLQHVLDEWKWPEESAKVGNVDESQAHKPELAGAD